MSRPLPIGEIPLYTIDYVIWTKQSQIKSLEQAPIQRIPRSPTSSCPYDRADPQMSDGIDGGAGLDGCAGVLAETCGVLMNLSCGVETSASLSDIINM